MDCATISSDVIGDFQEPYGAVLVDWDDMAALPSTACESGAGRPAVTPIRRVTAGRRRCADGGWGGPTHRTSRLPHYRDTALPRGVMTTPRARCPNCVASARAGRHAGTGLNGSPRCDSLTPLANQDKWPPLRLAEW